MKRITKLEVLKISSQENIERSVITSFKANDVRKAFCSIAFHYKNGGAAKSYQISKDTYNSLLNDYLFEIGQDIK